MADTWFMKVYDQLHDKGIVRRVNDLFYDKVYDHPWLSLYFEDIDKDFISAQQTDFIIGAIGGPENFHGRLPSNAHTHMMISHELFDLRKSLLEEALREADAPKILYDTWLRIDEAFRAKIVKSSVEECEKRYATDTILDFINPLKKAG